MDYKYDDGIELLLAHMNIEDIINAAENLYQIKEVEVEEEGGLLFEEESLSQGGDGRQWGGRALREWA